MIELPLWSLVGAASGLLAGLLGIGGGVVLVPALMYSLPILGIGGAELPQIAVATSLATILPTSISNLRAQVKHDAVDWLAAKRLAPGIVIGSIAGTEVAATIGGRGVLAVFLLFSGYAIWRMLPSKAKSAGAATELPSIQQLSSHGLGIGLLSSLVGVGGGLLTVPLLAPYVEVKRAIGTAAAVGLPLALAGMASYMVLGHTTHCDSGCLGYVYYPAALCTSIGSVAAAPVGAYLANKLPVYQLKWAFVILLAVVSLDLAAKLFA